MESLLESSLPPGPSEPRDRCSDDRVSTGSQPDGQCPCGSPDQDTPPAPAAPRADAESLLIDQARDHLLTRSRIGRAILIGGLFQADSPDLDNVLALVKCLLTDEPIDPALRRSVAAIFPFVALERLDRNLSRSMRQLKHNPIPMDEDLL